MNNIVIEIKKTIQMTTALKSELEKNTNKNISSNIFLLKKLLKQYINCNNSIAKINNIETIDINFVDDFIYDKIDFNNTIKFLEQTILVLNVILLNLTQI